LRSAIGASHAGNEIANIALHDSSLSNNVIAHFHRELASSREDPPDPTRCSKKMVVYDDVEPTDKIRVYDKGIVITARQKSATRLLSLSHGRRAHTQDRHHGGAAARCPRIRFLDQMKTAFQLRMASRVTALCVIWRLRKQSLEANGHEVLLDNLNITESAVEALASAGS